MGLKMCQNLQLELLFTLFMFFGVSGWTAHLFWFLLRACVVGRHRMYRKRLTFVAPFVAQTGVVLLPISTGSLYAYRRISSES